MDNRLKRQCDFNDVFSKGKRAYCKVLSIVSFEIKSEFVRKNGKKGYNIPKIGIAVGKKHGNAVMRNRVKRLVRAALREYITQIKPSRIVILPKPALAYRYDEILAGLGFVLKKQNLLKNEETGNLHN